ncbi:hypothetical protein [Nocardia fluminea]|uniref:hypothetical protein n=1 Tax=Nocardia fluminea TaxID=134984 RepID=UPI003400BA67
MTKAHLPPRCAGNDNAVTRSNWMVAGDTVTLGRAEGGGIWFRGQCVRCNSQAAPFDLAVGELASHLRPLWLAASSTSASTMMPLPAVTFQPGAVARSIVLGMSAVSPGILQRWPDVRRLLDPAAPAALPSGMKLYVAMTRGRTAWVSGHLCGFYNAGPRAPQRTKEGQPRLLNAVASVFFPPLAWQLVEDGAEMLDEQRWADISQFLSIPPGNTHNLHEFARELPLVRHPSHEVNGDDEWMILVEDTPTIIECLDVTAKDSDDALTRRRTMDRVIVSLDEIEALRRAH